jgi:hypothetical protein
MLATDEASNVAMSDGPFGTVTGTQLPDAVQNSEPGIADHVALPAEMLPGAASESTNTAPAKRIICTRRRRIGLSREIAIRDTAEKDRLFD